MAAIAMLRAIRTYDARIPLKRWVARCVKISIWHRWRKVRVRSVVKLQAESWDPACEDEPYSEEVLSQQEWQIMCEKYVDKWPDDVIARRHSMTVYEVRKLCETATMRLETI